jgi:hypothetical protein
LFKEVVVRSQHGVSKLQDAAMLGGASALLGWLGGAIGGTLGSVGGLAGAYFGGILGGGLLGGLFVNQAIQEGAEGAAEVANAFAVPLTNATLGDQAALSVQDAITKGGEFAADYGPLIFAAISAAKSLQAIGAAYAWRRQPGQHQTWTWQPLEEPRWQLWQGRGVMMSSGRQ